jgi:hypothetical protein
MAYEKHPVVEQGLFEPFFVKVALILHLAKKKFMKTTKPFSFILLFFAFSLFTVSCQKGVSGDSNKARLQVFLTDDPGNYEEVVINVQDIRINYTSDTSNGWQSLSNVNTGMYDVLKLVNDNDTLLADAELNPGRIQQIRLVLGNNNYVKVDGQVHQLETPSAQQSGLKLKINQDVEAGLLYKLLLDFDAARSIVKTGNNKYILKPVIRTSLVAVGGSLRGFVLPSTVNTAVFAIQGADTVAGTYTANGSYWIKGLTPGSYKLSFVPGDQTYLKQELPSISVSNSQVATVDTVRLQQ